MFDKLKKWYYRNCLVKELNKMEKLKNDPDYPLCVEGSKKCVEIQKCENRIRYYQFILTGHFGRELLSIWLKKNYPFEYLAKIGEFERCQKK